jgi:hypothetical protein
MENLNNVELHKTNCLPEPNLAHSGYDFDTLVREAILKAMKYVLNKNPNISSDNNLQLLPILIGEFEEMPTRDNMQAVIRYILENQKNLKIFDDFTSQLKFYIPSREYFNFYAIEIYTPFFEYPAVYQTYESTHTNGIKSLNQSSPEELHQRSKSNFEHIHEAMLRTIAQLGPDDARRESLTQYYNNFRNAIEMGKNFKQFNYVASQHRNYLHIGPTNTARFFRDDLLKNIPNMADVIKKSF